MDIKQNKGEKMQQLRKDEVIKEVSMQTDLQALVSLHGLSVDDIQVVKDKEQISQPIAIIANNNGIELVNNLSHPLTADTQRQNRLQAIRS